MGQTSSQIDPGTQQSQPGDMPPPPPPKERKRKRAASPATSVAGESTTASVQLAGDLEQSALEASVHDIEPPRKRKKRTSAGETNTQPSTKPKKRKMQERVLEPQAYKSESLPRDMAPAQVVIPVYRTRKRAAQDEEHVTQTVDPDETVDETGAHLPIRLESGDYKESVTESRDGRQAKRIDTKKRARAAPNSEGMSQSWKDDEDDGDDTVAQSHREEDDVAATSKTTNKRRDTKSGAQVKDAAEQIPRPDWLDSVPATSSGPFTKEERRVADRVFVDFAEEHDLAEYVLKKMIQNWREEAGDFKAHIQAALPNRPKDAVRKFCQRRYHTMERGPWTEVQDSDLRSAYLQWPDKWTRISDHVDRTAADCKDRWTKHLKFSQRSTGPWSTTEMIHLHQLVAWCMGAIVDAHCEGELDDDNLSDPNTYLELMNWRIIEEKINNVRSAAQCRQKFLKSWPRIVDAMDMKGIMPPYDKDNLIHHVQFGSQHDSPRPSQKSDRVESARKALKNFEIGDFYDVFVEIYTSFDDQNARFSDGVFWSIVGQKNVSRFSITWDGTAIRRIALQTALEDWPPDERKLARKLEKAETLQAKALLLAKYVEKRQRSEGLGELKRTYKPELIGKSRDDILEMKRNAKGQRKSRKPVKNEKEALSKDFVSESEDEVSVQLGQEDEHHAWKKEHSQPDSVETDNDNEGAEPDRQTNRSGGDDEFSEPEIQESEPEHEEGDGELGNYLETEHEHTNPADDIKDKSHSHLEGHETSSDDDSDSEEDTSSEDSQDASENVKTKEADAKRVEPVSEAEDSDPEAGLTPSKEQAARPVHFSDANPMSSHISRVATTKERLPVQEVPESEVEVEQSSSEDSTSSSSSDTDDDSDDSDDSGEKDQASGDHDDDKAASTQEVPETQPEDNGGATDDTTDEIVGSSVNSRYEGSLVGTPGLSPQEFLQRCQTVGRQQHARFTAINTPPRAKKTLSRVKQTYGSRRKAGF